MERVDDVSPKWLHFPVVALHVLVVEEVPEEIALLLTHLQHLLGDYPLQAAIFAGRNSGRAQVVPEIKGVSIGQMLRKVNVRLCLIRVCVLDGLEHLALAISCHFEVQ